MYREVQEAVHQHRAAAERQSVELRQRLSEVREAEKAEEAEVHTKEERAWTLAGLLKDAQEELATASLLAASLQAEAARRRSAAAAAADSDLAPLRRATYEAEGGLRALKGRLEGELSRRAREWEQFAARSAREFSSSHESARDALMAEIRSLKQQLREIAEKRQTSRVDMEASVDKLHDELSSSLWGLEDVQSERQHLETWHRRCTAAARRQWEGVRRMHQHIDEVAAQQRQDEEELEQESLEACRLHAESLERVRQDRDLELARLEALLRQSLDSLSAELSSDSDAALQAHSTLLSSGSRLALRARAQLGSGGGGT
mmetsp:Transcript_126217/g.403992  ORF Transcript_126217/g.403992 Transcript_126217/m.403992 type:complete len:318 (-) Transcript_126217:81-1034(-)